ncbi:hypothetical protein WH47_01916 [Habropoda laboriosa]|uniref:Uncharacterized protein n=1 Tax=Habropoda laboriosa TaxID=597456 RepID=A0A0L7QXZ7_9HYME|nr:hypothetical protein WH47_01916 [Habropoda laboriosa]
MLLIAKWMDRRQNDSLTRKLDQVHSSRLFGETTRPSSITCSESKDARVTSSMFIFPWRDRERVCVRFLFFLANQRDTVEENDDDDDHDHDNGNSDDLASALRSIAATIHDQTDRT